MRKRIWLLVYLIGFWFFGSAQDTNNSSVVVIVQNESKSPLANVTAELFRAKDSVLVKIQVTDSGGRVQFNDLSSNNYFIRISSIAYIPYRTPNFTLYPNTQIPITPYPLPSITLRSQTGSLSQVTVTARKPFIELAPGKTIVNLDAGITNAGTTVLEALEKMPGVTIDKDGNIALKGKQGVTVMIDGKPTYLGNTELAAMLGSMNSSQISQVELIDQPSSRYDAAGNAGIINIKTKKNTQKGFNGSVSSAYVQGVYPKYNSGLQLNYRSGKWNLFMNYSLSINHNFMKLYALRTYYKQDGTIESMLDQPSFFRARATVHNFRTGVDYFLNAKTTLGLGITGLALARKGAGNNSALWMDAQGDTDSLINTNSNSSSNWKNAGANLNFRHSFTASRELTADVDLLGYRILGKQFFENSLITPGTYTEASRADIPSDIKIISAKTDYSEQIKKWKLEAGLKTSHITTDNRAAFEIREGINWKEDLGRSNHFLYTENIHALYGNAETKLNKWKVQGGLRYEMTSYDANQLGNAVVKDSSFSRSYNSLFPSFFTSYEVDSNNTFSFSTGRRIDRPAFQKLNPFLSIINKYTYQRGNPFFRPQYSWNIVLSHLYKSILITGLSYSITKDYFSQIFLADSTGTIFYTEGNLGKLQTIGLSVGVQLSPLSWWSLSAQAVAIHRKMEGVIGRNFNESITQSNFNFNNQFRFKKGWVAELSGFYTSRAQNDIQEIVDPAGQLSAGVSKQILKNKGTVRLTARDIFYTQWMKGNSEFQGSTEYFKLTRDTRVINISISYRFGKAFKTNKRSEGSAGEEMQRVGNG